MRASHFCFANKGIINSPAAGIKLATIFCFLINYKKLSSFSYAQSRYNLLLGDLQPLRKQSFQPSFLSFLTSPCKLVWYNLWETHYNNSFSRFYLIRSHQKIAKQKANQRRLWRPFTFLPSSLNLRVTDLAKSDSAVKVLNSSQAVFWYPEVFVWNLSCVTT